MFSGFPGIWCTNLHIDQSGASSAGAKEWVEAQIADSTRYLQDRVDLRLYVTGDAAGTSDLDSLKASPGLETPPDEKRLEEIEEEKPVKTSW